MRFAIIGLLGAGFALAVLTIRRRAVRAVATDVGANIGGLGAILPGGRASPASSAIWRPLVGPKVLRGATASGRPRGPRVRCRAPVVARTVLARVHHDERVKGSVCKAVTALERYVAGHYDRAADGEGRQRSLDQRGVDCRPPRQLVVPRPGRQRVRLPGHRRTGGLTDGWDY